MSSFFLLPKPKDNESMKLYLYVLRVLIKAVKVEKTKRYRKLFMLHEANGKHQPRGYIKWFKDDEINLPDRAIADFMDRCEKKLVAHSPTICALYKLGRECALLCWNNDELNASFLDLNFVQYSFHRNQFLDLEFFRDIYVEEMPSLPQDRIHTHASKEYLHFLVNDNTIPYGLSSDQIPFLRKNINDCSMKYFRVLGYNSLKINKDNWNDFSFYHKLSSQDISMKIMNAHDKFIFIEEDTYDLIEKKSKAGIRAIVGVYQSIGNGKIIRCISTIFNIETYSRQEKLMTLKITTTGKKLEKKNNKICNPLVRPLNSLSD